jgi:hypothetical protein
MGRLKCCFSNVSHDFLGRGLGPASLLIWTHNFQYMNFSSNFIYSTGQQAGFPGMIMRMVVYRNSFPLTTTFLAITVGPGVQWVDAYAFAAQNQVFLPGGIGPLGSVGAGGGWPLGGGHNILSPSYGLGTRDTSILPATKFLRQSNLFRSGQRR